MAKKVKTINWCKNRITETLSKSERFPTDAILFSVSMRKRDIDEDLYNYDIALQNLIQDGIVVMTNEDGYKVYKLSA